MIKNGTYAAWFKTPLNQGAGVAHLADGKISGSDSIMTYTGTYTVNGDAFTATLKTKRHSEGHATVFGLDNLTLRLEGTFVDKVGSYIAKADEVPGMVLEGTLIRTEEEHPLPKPSRAVPTFHPERVPTLPKRSR
jgi:hypothetical protein